MKHLVWSEDSSTRAKQPDGHLLTFYLDICALQEAVVNPARSDPESGSDTLFDNGSDQKNKYFEIG